MTDKKWAPGELWKIRFTLLNSLVTNYLLCTVTIGEYLALSEHLAADTRDRILVWMNQTADVICTAPVLV